MNSILNRLLAIGITWLAGACTGALAQVPTGPGKSPTSKLYLAEAKGDTQVQSGEKIYTPEQAAAFDAPGTVIETKAGSHGVFVYSNGTGLFIGENSRVVIERFVQEPFNAERNSSTDVLIEPSVSQSIVAVLRGSVGIYTSRLLSNSSMSYTTPLAIITIRGGRIAIECDENQTIVDLLEGDITVRGGETDVAGRILRPGERAVIRASLSGGAPSFTISPTPPDLLPSVVAKVDTAGNARKAVFFDISEDTQEIVANPAVPERQSANIVVSPDRLPGT